MDALPAAWFSADGALEHGSYDAPNEASRRALVAWAEARGMSIVIPEPSSSYALDVDVSLADGVEKDLATARDALTRLDADAAERALSHSSATLRKHPELPQAAWLLAEVDRAWASRWMRIAPVDPERAARAWQEAAALDGGRAAGIGEAGAPRPAEISVAFELAAGAGTEVRVDGALVAAGPAHIAAGEHAVVASRDGRVVWADWVSIVANGAVVVVPSFGPRPCSTGDLDHARGNGDRIDGAGVACARWVAAVPQGSSAVRVAVCERSRCGPFVEWQSHGGALAPILPPEHEKHSKAPLWIGVTAVGVVAVIAATSIALVASGAFEPAPHETKFVGGGVKTAGQ